jgi:hypothetical protein
VATLAPAEVSRPHLNHKTPGLLAGPATQLYPPLRSLIYIDCGDRTRFAVEQFSTVFACFADPVIA